MQATCKTIIIMALLFASRAALAGSEVEHSPPIQVPNKQTVDLVVRAPTAQEPNLHLRYRKGFGSPWTDLKFRRQKKDAYIASIPAAAVRSPGVEYFITGSLRSDSSELDIFASEEEPHRILVRHDEKKFHEAQILEAYRGRRSKVKLSTEWVNFGSRIYESRADDGTATEYSVPDSYLRVDLDFTYRLASLPLRSLRFGYTRLLGITKIDDLGPSCFPDQSDGCSEEAGYKVGGWFELGLSMRRATAVDLRGMVMATSEGFKVGGRGELRIGDEYGTHIAAGADYMADVGNSLFFRMGWATITTFPMALTIAGSNIPADHLRRGLRVLYDVGHELDGGLRLGLRLNYQSRDDLAGAIGGGVNSSFEF